MFLGTALMNSYGGGYEMVNSPAWQIDAFLCPHHPCHPLLRLHRRGDSARLPRHWETR